MQSILQRDVSRDQMIRQGDFLGFTLSNPNSLAPFDFTTPAGITAQVWDTGVLCLTPAAGRSTEDLVLSCGVHGNETAPIELCAALIRDLLTGALPLAQRVLFLIGNPPAINAGKRELVDNLNRLFSGHHRADEAGASWERQRAARLEQYVSRFFAEAPANTQSDGTARPRALYDLHTAIRGSAFEKFAVYPFLHGKPWSEAQLCLLKACGVDTFLLMQTPASTFSYYASHSHGAHAFTLELGKVRPFGQNDMQRFASCANTLRALLSGAPLALPAFVETEFNFFVVSRAVNKQSDAFELCFARDIENFTQFPLGTVLARDAEQVYTVDEAGEAIIFPNADVQIGQRAMLLVKPVSLAGRTA